MHLLVWHVQSIFCPSRFGLASVLHVVVGTIEELFVEKCYDLITTAALRAMGGCKKLKVRDGLSQWSHIICVAYPPLQYTYVMHLCCMLAALGWQLSACAVPGMQGRGGACRS